MGGSSPRLLVALTIIAALATVWPGVLTGIATAADVTARGAVVLRWQSDPQTCGDYGLCGRWGAITWRPGGGVGFDVADRGRGVSLDFFESSAIVRSARSTSGGTRVCVDETAGPRELDAFGSHGAAVRLTLGDEPGLDPGRCSGPLPADFAAALPRSKPFRPARLAHRGSIDMRSRRAFSAGPFTGEVVSTLVFRIGRVTNVDPAARAATIPPRAHGAARTTRVGRLEMIYAIDGVAGQATLAFAGASSAPCELLDACGLSGQIQIAGTATTGQLEITSARDLRPGQRETQETALAALRAGKSYFTATSMFGDPERDPEPQTATFPVSEHAGVAGEPVCSDHSQLHAENLDVDHAPGGVAVALVSSDEPPDELRTRCPGPAGSDIGLRVASGLLPLEALGEERPALTLHAPSHFASLGFDGGDAGGGLDVALRLASIRVITDHVPAGVGR